MLDVFFWKSCFLINGNGDIGHFHKHYPYQLIVSSSQEITVDTKDGSSCRSKVLLIDSNIDHSCRDHGNSISLFFDPYTNEGKAFKQKYIKSEISALPVEKIENFIDSFEEFRHSPVPAIERAASLHEKILYSYIDREMRQRPTDERIGRILDILPDIPDKKISVKMLAAGVNLSETRLIHLFKQNMGIPIRRFLLWKRLLDAVKLIRDGESFTMSAIEAGFADYAHFSRTFKTMFGSTVESIFKNDRFVHVYSQ